MSIPDTILEVRLAGLTLRNPVILASGTAGYLDELGGVMDLSRVGAVVTKSITALPREGNPTWRILETKGGLLNAIGLANMGVESFVRDVAPRIERAQTSVIGSIAGFSIEDYTAVAAAFGGIPALAGAEVNVSCPNVHGGTEFGADPGALRELLRAVKPLLGGKPLMVKLSPISIAAPCSTMVDIAAAAIAGGADILCIANTIPAMGINVETRTPRLANITGGLSGPAVHPVAVKLVHDVYRKAAREAGVPIVGIGGVLGWEDAAEFILAGAGAVEMGTALFADPRSPQRVVAGLSRWAQRQGVRSIGDLVGGVMY